MSVRRVLIVEDERLARLSLRDYLWESGYDVDAADSGAAALDMQQERGFDTFIVDIRMPDMDGVETILALHKLAPTARYIVYTGSPHFRLPPELLDLGLSERDVVRKPVLDMKVFIDLIES